MIEECSKDIRQRVNLARNIQKQRHLKYGIYSNSELEPKFIEKFCKLTSSSMMILKKYFSKNNMSARSYSKVLKVARTIADLEESTLIKDKHVLEALRYRLLDKN